VNNPDGKPPPDIVLLGAEWQPRALIRAQLIQEGFDVVATNSWPMMRRYLKPGSTPHLAIVDLKGLPNPENVLKDLHGLIEPRRVLVLTAAGTVPAAEIDRLGFSPVARPTAIKDIVDRAAQAIQRPVIRNPPR
jgi:hypothetical protein